MDSFTEYIKFVDLLTFRILDRGFKWPILWNISMILFSTFRPHDQRSKWSISPIYQSRRPQFENKSRVRNFTFMASLQINMQLFRNILSFVLGLTSQLLRMFPAPKVEENIENLNFCQILVPKRSQLYTI